MPDTKKKELPPPPVEQQAERVLYIGRKSAEFLKSIGTRGYLETLVNTALWEYMLAQDIMSRDPGGDYYLDCVYHEPDMESLLSHKIMHEPRLIPGGIVPNLETENYRNETDRS